MRKCKKAAADAVVNQSMRNKTVSKDKNSRKCDRLVISGMVLTHVTRGKETKRHRSMDRETDRREKEAER